MTLRERQAREYAAEVRAERREERRILAERIARYIRRFGIHPARMSRYVGVTVETALRDVESTTPEHPQPDNPWYDD